MEFNPSAIIGVILQIVGFVVLCRLGASLSDKLMVKSEWLPLGISALVIVAGVVVCFVVSYPLTFVPQTIALFCVAFGGGMLVRLRSRKFGE